MCLVRVSIPTTTTPTPTPTTITTFPLLVNYYCIQTSNDGNYDGNINYYAFEDDDKNSNSNNKFAAHSSFLINKGMKNTKFPAKVSGVIRRNRAHVRVRSTARSSDVSCQPSASYPGATRVTRSKDGTAPGPSTYLRY